MREAISPVTRKEQKQIDLGNMVVIKGQLYKLHPNPAVLDKKLVRRVAGN